MDLCLKYGQQLTIFWLKLRRPEEQFITAITSYCYLSHPCVAWAGWFGQKKKTRQLNIYQCVASNQKHKNSRETHCKLTILTPSSRHLLRHKFPLGSTMLKYAHSQSACSIHCTWPIVSNPVPSTIHVLINFWNPWWRIQNGGHFKMWRHSWRVIIAKVIKLGSFICHISLINIESISLEIHRGGRALKFPPGSWTKKIGLICSSCN